MVIIAEGTFMVHIGKGPRDSGAPHCCMGVGDTLEEAVSTGSIKWSWVDRCFRFHNSTSKPRCCETIPVMVWRQEVSINAQGVIRASTNDHHTNAKSVGPLHDRTRNVSCRAVQPQRLLLASSIIVDTIFLDPFHKSTRCETCRRPQPR